MILNKIAQVVVAFAIALSFNAIAADPTIAELHAYKAYHHAEYLKVTAKQAGGTNMLLHTTKLPSEGNDPVVSPALDHLYSKAVIDLTKGPVFLDMPEVESDRYFSMMITDQEHYVTYEEVDPNGIYMLVHHDWKGDIPKGVKVLNNRGYYPHLFIRTQVKTQEDLVNTLAVQQKVKLTGEKGVIEFTAPLKWTVETHDVYPENEGLLKSVIGQYTAEDQKRLFEFVGGTFIQWNATRHVVDNKGMFGPIDDPTQGSNDPITRAVGIIAHLGLPHYHAYYTGIATDCEGKELNGDGVHVITLPYKAAVKGKGFWSITRYSSITRNTYPNANDIYNAYNTKPDANGNVTITFSSKDPQDGTYWMPVNAGEPYYYAERYYQPDFDNLVILRDRCKK